MTPVELTYAFDAYCGWCYGFAPALHRFVDANADRIRLRVLSGGLFSGAAAGPISAYPHIPAANERIARLTGVTFGAPYQRMLAEGTTMMDSTAAATGLVALRRQAPERALEFAAAMQEAWYLHGRDLGDVAVYRDIATGKGIDAQAVTEDYTHPATRTEAEQDFRALRRLGVSQYPTLLLHSDTGVHRLGGPVSSAEALSAALDAQLAAATT
ncbi:DsbA family protein [Nocardiopsis exhalans]|uniref:DsbA family protein n=1 Tax=Nocardiopsis exhalans TaxID=163604 RepID=A0ABY5D313_9ACTN|nr:DsbA family protein [Nocardiopsis exhalans]USY18781.1 DsbA family protein [Nocardiopsis exhalans]